MFSITDFKGLHVPFFIVLQSEELHGQDRIFFLPVHSPKVLQANIENAFFSVRYNCFLCLMQGWFRAVWRFIYFAISTLWSIAGFFVDLLLGKSRTQAGIRQRRRWLNHIPKRMGIRLRLEGTPHTGPCLYVGNHISYIDPVIVLMHTDANVVAKAEVARWPLIGYGAYIVGTIFVKRDEKDSRLATAQTIRDALMRGISILVFPEGTTTAGPEPMPFRPRSFDAALEAGVPVQPIAIIYDCPEAAFIGEDTFLPHFFKLFRLKYIRGRVAFGPLLYAGDTMTQAHGWIRDQQSTYQLNSAAHDPA